MCTQLFQFLNLPICWSVFWWHFTPSCGAWAFGLLQVIFPHFFFILFWFLQLWLTGIVGEILELKSFLPFLCWRSFYSAKCIFRDSWSFCRPGVCICHTSLLRYEFSFIHRYTQIEREPMHTIDNFFEKCPNRCV